MGSSAPLSTWLLSQTSTHRTDLRFVSQSTNADKQVGKSTDAANVASAENEEAEDDILYKRLQIEARCADRAVLESYEKFVSMSANYLGINISRVWEPFRTIKRRTLLRASFVKKKYRVQYEWRTYYRCMEFKHLTGSTADTFLEYIERNLPESVALKVTRERIEKIPSHLVPPAQS
ncbi:28S ribosomal protein S10, mitochondrial [Tyrophagus putrescentiae]|nr:28S ribosomal protein S10, mitochondrial [Tyrophagus putrescentiae]